MLDRLAGLETEYALRFTPAPGAERPRNDALFAAIAEAIRTRVRTLPGRRRLTHDQLFTENGGSLYFERSPTEPDGGLLEAATPECRGPGQLLLYQQAQEAMLRRALPLAEATLHRAGHPGHLGLLKNGRDAHGNTYGVQENFDTPLATGPLLHLYRAGLALLIPVMILDVLICWTLILAMGLLLIATALTLLLLDAAATTLLRKTRPDILTRAFQDPERRLERRLMRSLALFEMLIVMPAVLPFTWLVHLCAFRPIRRSATAFFISRPALTGTGTLHPDDTFTLSEKATTIRRLVRSTAAPYSRAIYDTGNLLKGLQGLFLFDFARLAPLFARRQRLQLGLADANRCQAAEYLKLGTTLLVLDMIEAGALTDAPRPTDPVAALHHLTHDPTLRAQIPLRHHPAMTALQIQRWYLDRARHYIAHHPAPALEAHEIIRLWTEALDALETDPGTLVGRLDWITKRYLIENAAPTAPHAVRKKIDLRYHELGDGYLARMEDAGLAPRLVTPEEAIEAITTPPDRTPARQRGRLIRTLADRDQDATAGWDAIRIGAGLRGRIVRLDAFRKVRSRPVEPQDTQTEGTHSEDTHLKDIRSQVTFIGNPATRGTTTRDTAIRDAAIRDAAIRDAAIRHAATRDDATRDDATRDDATRDAATRDAATHDTATHDAATHDAATHPQDTRSNLLTFPRRPTPAPPTPAPPTLAPPPPPNDPTPPDPPEPTQ